MCLTTALHSPTSINRRLLAASKEESHKLSNPPFLNFTDLSVGVSTGTHPPTLTGNPNYHREPPHSTKHRQPPCDQVRSVASSVGYNKLSPFFTIKKPKLFHTKPWLSTVLHHVSRASSNVQTRTDEQLPHLLLKAFEEEPLQRVFTQRFHCRSAHSLVLNDPRRWLTIP